MDSKQYYNELYFGLKNSFSPMVSIGLLAKYLREPVLDVGCGQGRIVKELCLRGIKTQGCDIFEGVKNLGRNFFFHDMEEKPTSKKYASIYSIHVLEHIFDYISFLQNIQKSLIANGTFYLAVPNAYSLLSRAKYLLGDEKITLGVGELNCIESNKLEPHLRFFGKKSLQKILELNGFKVLDCFGTNISGEKHWLNTFGGQLNFILTKMA